MTPKTMKSSLRPINRAQMERADVVFVLQVSSLKETSSTSIPGMICHLRCRESM